MYDLSAVYIHGLCTNTSARAVVSSLELIGTSQGHVIFHYYYLSLKGRGTGKLATASTCRER